MKRQKHWRGVWIVMCNILEDLLFHGMMENAKEDTDEVVIEISITQIDPIDLEKNIPEVDFGLLLSNLPSTMSVIQFLEKRRS